MDIMQMVAEAIEDATADVGGACCGARFKDKDLHCTRSPAPHDLHVAGGMDKTVCAIWHDDYLPSTAFLPTKTGPFTAHGLTSYIYSSDTRRIDVGLRRVFYLTKVTGRAGPRGRRYTDIQYQIVERDAAGVFVQDLGERPNLEAAHAQVARTLGLGTVRPCQ